MNLSRFTHALAGAAVFAVAAASSLTSAPTLSASVTINDNGSCNWSWDATTRTLSCSPAGGGTPPVCTVSGVTSGQLGGSVTLTANCPGATSYTWGGAACSPAGSPSGIQCTASSTGAPYTSYVVKGTNAGGTGDWSLAHTIVWSSTAVFSCTLAPAGPTTPGTSLPLSMSCTGGTPTSTSWSASGPGTATFANPVTGSGVFSNSVAFSAAGLYTITATAAGASATSTSVQVNAQTVAPSGGNICAQYGFSKTIRSTWDWTSNSNHSIDTYLTADTDGNVGLGPNGILVVDFVATGPLDTTPHIGWASATGYPAPNMSNLLTVSISTSPCTLYAPNPGSATDNSPFVTFGVGAVNQGWASGAQDVSLTPGVRYYINVAGRTDVSANSLYGTATCVPGRQLYPYCDLRLEFAKPQGH